MSRIQEIAFLVFGPLSVGGVFLLSLPSLTTVGLGFFRTNGLVFLISVIAGLLLFPLPYSLWHPPAAGYAILFFSLFILILFIYNLRLWFRQPYHSRSLLLTAAALGVAAILATVRYYLPPAVSFTRLFSLSIYFLNSGLLLGSGVLGMLLGHSYLTRPSLSIVPLLHLTRIFMLLVFVEGGLAFANLIVAFPSPRLRDALLLNTIEGLYLWIRLLIGIVGPIILAPMILKTVHERATMSATGLLYIAMLMVMVGEIFSRFFLLMDIALL